MLDHKEANAKMAEAINQVASALAKKKIKHNDNVAIAEIAGPIWNQIIPDIMGKEFAKIWVTLTMDAKIDLCKATVPNWQYANFVALAVQKNLKDLKKQAE